MIDHFTLGLTHGLMLFAAFLLLRRPDLDSEAPPRDGSPNRAIGAGNDRATGAGNDRATGAGQDRAGKPPRPSAWKDRPRA